MINYFQNFHCSSDIKMNCDHNAIMIMVQFWVIFGLFFPEIGFDGKKIS